MEIVEDFLNKTSQETHILFDGIPRTVKQASMLSTLLKNKGRLEIGVYIDLSEKAALERLLLRKRGDDTPESIKKRFANYYESTLPVIDQYKANDRLVHINGDQKIDEVTSSIIDAVTHYE
jgi:adenylate kinase family enzyme